MMKVENALGALIAAVILFVTGALALLQTPGITSIGDIPQLAWIVLGGGALLSFLKDSQALATRRAISKVTGNSGN